MSSRRILQAIKILFFALVIGVPLFYFKWGIYPYIVPKSAFFQIVVEVIFFLWVALAISDKRYRLRMTSLHWGILAYLAVLTAAAFAGIDPLRSFFSSYERAFGVFLWYHLAALAFAASALSRELPWKKIWYASLATSVATIAIALLQLRVPNLLLIEAVIDRPGATFGNPTFLAGYLLTSVFVAGYYLLRRPASRGEAVFLWIAATADVLGIFTTQTRGDILGLFTGIFTLVFFFAVKPPEASRSIFRSRRFYRGLLFALLVFAALVWFTRESTFWNGIPGFDRLKDISFSAEGGIAPRLIALRAAWQGFLEKPLLGWGPENFNVVFSKHYNPRALEFGYAETDFDKPHSAPLEELVSGGVPLLLAYLAVLALFVWKAKHAGEPLFFAIAAALAAAYFVRSSVIFDTIGSAMMLYLFFGFASAAGVRVGAANAPPPGTGKVSPAIILLAAVPALALIYFFNLKTVAASYHSFRAHYALQIEGNTAAAMADFRKAVDPWSVYQWGFVQDYANTIAQAYFYDHGIVPRDDIKYAIGRLKEVAAAHPEDAYNHYLLASVYNLVSDIDPENYLPEAEREAAKALELSPNRQEILFYLAKTKSLEGENAAALEIAKRALDLDPKVADSHFYYGMLAFALGRNEEGYREVSTAIKMGRAWHSFYEPRVAADYFADAGHLTEAIGLYRAALRVQPGDLEAEIKLGAAYFISGQNDLARPLLADAASRFDFTKSPQYGEYKPILDALGIAVRPAGARP